MNEENERLKELMINKEDYVEKLVNEKDNMVRTLERSSEYLFLCNVLHPCHCNMIVEENSRKGEESENERVEKYNQHKEEDDKSSDSMDHEDNDISDVVSNDENIEDVSCTNIKAAEKDLCLENLQRKITNERDKVHQHSRITWKIRSRGRNTR